MNSSHELPPPYEDDSAKIAKEFDYKKDEIVSGILRMLTELPLKSKAVSRRLLIDDPDTLQSDVSRNQTPLECFF